MTSDQEQHRQCLECGKALIAPKRTPRGKPVGRNRIYCSDACSKRARRRPTSDAVAPELPPGTTHVGVAESLIGAVRVLRGDDYAAQDAAEAQHLLTLAKAVDADPSSVSALRELRLTQSEFRRLASLSADEDEQNKLAELIARLRGPDVDTYRRVYEATLAAGASEDVATAAARAATH